MNTMTIELQWAMKLPICSKFILFLGTFSLALIASFSLTLHSDWLALGALNFVTSKFLASKLLMYQNFSSTQGPRIASLFGRLSSFYVCRTQEFSFISTFLLRCTTTESPSDFPTGRVGLFSCSCRRSRLQVLEGKHL